MDNRKGFAFNNPDLTSNHYYDNWGLIVTPDELRYVILFGTRLVSSDMSQVYTDEMLQYYIDNAIGLVERDLDIHIYPRIIRHQNLIDPNTGQEIERDDIPPNESNRYYEPGYPYRENESQHYFYVRLRHRPLNKILKAFFVSPNHNKIIDLYPWRREFRGLQSEVQFYPRGSISLYSTDFFSVKLLTRYPLNNFPDTILIDYKTGWENAKDVPKDLVEAIRLIAGIALLNDFGDGRTAALANQSTNLNSISESFSTTMSATSAMYGARIIQFQKQLKDWYSRNHEKYKRTILGVLG